MSITDQKIAFTYLYQTPNKFTFKQKKLKKWVEGFCKGKVLNLFAGQTILDVDEFRVDLNPEMIADWYGDAYDFVTTTDLKFDTVVLDPPYNLRKAREKYNGNYIGSFTKIKNELLRVLNPGAIIITLGYDSLGMGRKRGFKKIAICLICHMGDFNDTITVVEERLPRIEDYMKEAI